MDCIQGGLFILQKGYRNFLGYGSVGLALKSIFHNKAFMMIFDIATVPKTGTRPFEEPLRVLTYERVFLR
jgi:hypothetical protein